MRTTTDLARPSGAALLIAVIAHACLAAAAAHADGDDRHKAYHHGSIGVEPGVIFRTGIDGVRPDVERGLLLVMVDRPVAEVEGLEACPSKAETGVPGHWLVLGPADDAGAAAAYSAARSALVHERRAYVEAVPERHPVMGWCRALGVTLHRKKR